MDPRTLIRRRTLGVVLRVLAVAVEGISLLIRSEEVEKSKSPKKQENLLIFGGLAREHSSELQIYKFRTAWEGHVSKAIFDTTFLWDLYK